MTSRMRVIAIVGMIAFALAGQAGAQEQGSIAVIGGSETETLPTPKPPAVAASSGVVESIVDPAPAKPKKRPAEYAKAPPPVLTVSSNINTKFGIALYHANRILTPFKNPEIQTSSTAGISVEQGIVYVTTDRPDPISMFVYDRADPAMALSLTLIPQEMSPVSTRVNLTGYEGPTPGAQYARATDDNLANSFETEDAYVNTLKTLFKGLALGKVPSGYGLETVRGSHPLMPACSMPGVRFEPLQVLTGHSVIALVARATNYGYQPIEFAEGACRSSRLLATAAWPTSSIGAGQSVEIYIAVRAPDESDAMPDRPSVIAGGR